MSILSTLSTDESIKVAADTLGGNGPLDSGLYDSKISVAYVITSQGGAKGLVLHLKTNTGREHRETLWMTSGTAKGCKNYYTNQQGEKQYLPGFDLANNLALLTVGKEISAMDTESKVVNVWSFEAQAEVPTKVDMVTDLLDQDIIMGVIKQVVDKTQKADDGSRVPTGETREEAVIDKFFRSRDRMTAAEIRAQAETPEFIDRWADKWTGEVRNKAKGASGTSGAPRASASTNKKPTASLFG